MKVSPARKAAYDILFRIESESAYSSALLPIYEADLSPADRGLCHELVLGILRRQIYLDCVIDQFSRGKKLDREVRLALRLGLYQLSFLDKIPAYSAITESVNLVQIVRKTSAKGFVNAILRKATREDPKFSYADETERISVETSHPRWLIEKWINDIGIDEAQAIAAANNETPKTSFRVLDELSSQGKEVVQAAERSEYVDGALFATGKGSVINELASRGELYVQDEASQLVAHSVSVPAGGRYLDVCAAPGGKTGLVALLNRSAGAIVAGDLHRSRVEFLRNNCRKQGVGHVNVVQYDAELPLPFEFGSFDTVLVDAPCSGTGTIRSNPEIRYRLDQADLVQLHQKQLTILSNASNLVKPGGSVYYSTCSIEPEENESVCTEFLGRNPGFVVQKLNIPDRFITDRGFGRTWPHRDAMDGFFIARLDRSRA